MILDLEKIKTDGWIRESAGAYQSSGKLKYHDEHFLLVVRQRPIDDFFKKSSIGETGKPLKINENSEGSKSPYGGHNTDLTPCNDETLPELAHFSEFPSLKAARSDRPSLLIGFDTEWVSGREEVPRKMTDMLSWQFACIWEGKVWEFVFFRKGEKGLSLELALGRILDHFGYKCVDVRKVRWYRYCDGFNDNGDPDFHETNDLMEAIENSVYVYRDGTFTHERIADMPDRHVKRSERDWAWFHTYYNFKAEGISKINVTIVCHTGKVDISALDQRGSKKMDLMRCCQAVQGGVITARTKEIYPVSVDPLHGRNTFIYPVRLSVADTMCHAPAGSKSLETLGSVVGVPKIELPTEPCIYKEHMDRLLVDDPCLYLKYAGNDSVVTLMYASALYGYNRCMPVTVTSAAARAMKEVIMNVLNCKTSKEYERVYRGTEKVSHGLVKEKSDFIEASSIEPISNDANTVQQFASKAYHGGYNGCSDVGFFDCVTNDFDLKNAYPTAMCAVPDINWENPVKQEIINRYLTIDDWHVIESIYNPLMPFLAYVRYEFPEGVKYPTIPIAHEGSLIFPRTSHGIHGVYACGPELYLAVRLGARVFCERGYVLNTLKNGLSESYSLRAAVAQLVRDRDAAKALYDKGSLEELILKTMVNSGYGKVAQNVIKKQTWSAYKKKMEDMGCSSITNPVSACMITSIVRAELLAAQNQAHERGYMTCSVTTDGFITDMPEDVLVTLDLMGLKPFMEKMRLFLTEEKDARIWEKKHQQTDLLNMCTRGNMSLSPEGVCAHNGVRSPYEKKSYDDRLWMMEKVLSRTGRVDSIEKRWSTFKELVNGDGFVIKEKTIPKSMDFDLKRKPLRETFVTVRPCINGVTYETVNFTTVPYENVEEYRTYRNKAKDVNVLRTMEDWQMFFARIDLKGRGVKVRDMEWARLFSCIMGYRAGMWDIPALTRIQDECREKREEERTKKRNENPEHVHMVADICRWINDHNGSGKLFKESDWKNARRADRQSHMLPLEMIEDLLEDLQTFI